jgi:phospholipid/cholesterol/gamma-HCH transport system substrate-binding protein
MPFSRKKVTLSEMRIGLLALAALGVLLFLTLNASGDLNPFKQKLRLRARFADAGGLAPGAEVRLAGVRVGKVCAVRFLPASAAKGTDARLEADLCVNASIDGQPAGERIRTDSVARLDSSGLIGGEKMVNITLGTAEGEPVRNGSELRATSSDGFSELASSGGDLMKRLDAVSAEAGEVVSKINKGQGTLGRMVNDEAFYNSLLGTVRDADEVIRQVRSGKGTAARLVSDPALYEHADALVQQLQSIATDLRAGRGTAGKLLTDDAFYTKANATLARLDVAVGDIESIVAQAKAGKGTVGKLLTDEAMYNDAHAAINNINSTAARMDQILAQAQGGQGTVGRLLTDDRLYNDIDNFTGEGTHMIQDFRKNPKKYLTIKLDLF